VKFETDNLYHLYNRGNNKQPVFYSRDNYLFFREKARKTLLPHCDILAWCLMPNHFHFLVYTKRQGLDSLEMSRAVGVVLRSYTRAVNRQEDRVGSLFQQHSKAKPLAIGFDNNHAFYCLHYIHQNPLRAGLVKKMEHWEFSSFNEYYGKAKEPLASIDIAQRLGLVWKIEDFYKESYEIFSSKAGWSYND
jgi:putative transposase